MKKQINVGDLKRSLEGLDEHYVVEVSLGEQTDLLKHMFIDSDSGVVELSNYEDDDESQPHFYDEFDQPIYLNSTVLFVELDRFVGLKKGKIVKMDVDDEYARLEIKPEQEGDNIVKREYFLVNNREITGKIISFKY